MSLSRRNFLRSTGALGAASLPLACSSEDTAEEQDNLDQYTYDGPLGPETTFQHSVASGDPLTDAIVLWTRVSPEKLDAPVDVWWEIGTDRAFKKRVAVGTVSTNADRDYTVKVDVTGLSAGTTYYYRFKALGRTSPAGRTKTAPAGDVKRLRFGVTSCSSMAHGYFHVYRDLAQELDLDAVLHLGDYIYEYGSGEYGDVRPYEPEHEILTLEDYRTRHAQYKRDPDVQAIHKQHPFIAVWDDHESADNSYKDGAENHDPATEGDWAPRKAAAIKAYTEWMPIRGGEDGKIFRSFSYGNLADLVFLDTRLWGRDEQDGKLLGEAPVEEPGRTLLGDDQETWLDDQLKTSQATWRIVGQQVMMAFLKSTGAPNSEGGGTLVNHDQWQGYPGSQQRFMSLLSDNQIDNVVVLTGDIHSGWGCDLTPDPNNTDFYDPTTGKGSVGVEFVTSAVTSPGFPAGIANVVENALVENPHIKYSNVTQRGFFILDLDAQRAQAAWYVYDDIETPDGGVKSLDSVLESKSGTNFLVPGGDPASPKDAPPAAP
ncbi:MAG: alkaline phosphatase D family protein [Polyangiaceae bacterium]